MIIVGGHLIVRDRDRYLEGCRDVVTAAHNEEGCLAFELAADPFVEDRVVVFEVWRSADELERFRGSGPDDGQAANILDAGVVQYECTKRVVLSGADPGGDV